MRYEEGEVEGRRGERREEDEGQRGGRGEGWGHYNRQRTSSPEGSIG